MTVFGRIRFLDTVSGNNSTVRKRHLFATEEMVRKYPEMCLYDGPSFSVHQDIQIATNVSLAKEAAVQALEEWGQLILKITHLVFCMTSGVDLPGADYHLIDLMGIPHNVKRVMLYGHGCFSGRTDLRITKDLAENNSGARVLVVCCDTTISCFRGQSKDDSSSLVSHAIFGDGAAAMVAGADPIDPIERPVFAVFSTLDTIIPNSKSVVSAYFGDAGLKYYITQNVLSLIAEKIQGILTEAFSPLGIDDRNFIFWAAHPAGPSST